MLFLQLYTVFVAAALAYLNRVPCKKMMNYGASLNEEKEFHRANAILKLLLILVWPVIMLLVGRDVIECLLVFLVLHLEMWIVFDCVLGQLLLKDPFYIGNTAKTDKLLRQWFKDYAGLVKILVVSSAVLVINFFL